jgi:pimeloyl-ACP methyl ester carboxylesterase
VVVGGSVQQGGSLRRRGLGALAAGALAVALAVSGCSGLGLGGDTAAPSTDAAAEAGARTPPSGQAGLARFYDQKLTWSSCRGFQCARLTVPLDYARPDGATVSIAVLKAGAKGHRRGSLVVNPGGPGGSGVQYAAAADFIVSKQVRDSYDIVGFDPRGVGSSQPVTCLDDRELDAFLGEDPTPDTKAEEQSFAANAKDLAAKCAARGGPLLAHVSTIEAAKDMDVLRAALLSPKLDYLGKSYGTFLGATYADLFPAKVGRFVLDGVVAPDLTSTQVNQGQAEGFETATRAYVADCVKGGGCPLGSSVDEGMQRLRDFLKQLDTAPIKVDDPHVTRLTEGWGSLGIAAAMYDESTWGSLTQALDSAFKGDGNALMKLADSYAERSQGGDYSGNLMQVIYAVNCLDRSDSKDLAHYEGQARAFQATAPTWGSFLAWSTVPCGFWPVPANNAPKKITAAGSGPIVVVGTTRDPATPYAWAKRLADQLQNGHLITYDGDGHTAYMRGGACVDGAVDAYLLKGTVPAAGLRC